MGQIIIADIEDEILRAIAVRAETIGRSAQDVAREALKRGLLYGADERVALARRVRALQPGPLDVDTTEMVRRLRDAD